MEDPVNALTFSIGNSPHAGAGVRIDHNRYLQIDPKPGWIGSTGVEIKVRDSAGLTAISRLLVVVHGGHTVYLPVALTLD